MIFVGGTSSSGKSTTIAHLIATRPEFRHVAASRLLREEGRPLRPITGVEADENQRVLARLLVALPENVRERALLDGHAMIETTDGLRAVPDDWYREVGFEGFVHIEAESGVVLERRRRRLLGWTASIVRRAQSAERDAIRRQAKLLRVPFLALESDDVTALSQWLSTAVSSRWRASEGR